MLCAIYSDTEENAPSNGAENHEFLNTGKAKPQPIQLPLQTIGSLLFCLSLFIFL